MTAPDPFLIHGPAMVSFSGGRTSAFMLRRILQAHGGELPPDVVVCFANTGREMPATLDFVRDCGEHWGVPIRWLEYHRDDAGHVTAREVSHETASRNGEPFEMAIAAKQMLPNPVARYCTQELKIRTIRRWIVRELGWKTWSNIVGLRADEPKRVARIERRNASGKERYRSVTPLSAAGVDKAEVMAFWAAQNFDLGLAGDWEGNCDGCFLKRITAIARMWRDHPERMRWWADVEIGAVVKGTLNPTMALFRKDRPSFAALGAREFDQARLALAPDDDGFDVFAACEGGCGV